MVELFLVQPRMTTSSPADGKGSKGFPSGMRTLVGQMDYITVCSLLAWKMETRLEEYITSVFKSHSVLEGRGSTEAF